MFGRSKTIPKAPAGFDPQQFFAGVYWHQTWQLFQDVFTPGINPIEPMCDDMNLPTDLSGKRVLDLGAANGCLSFECERRGASEVIALSPEDPHVFGFYKLRDILDSRRVRYLRGSVYELNPSKLGAFDIVLFCGVLYHLRYPLLGIDNIRRVCKGELYAETYVSDSQLILKEGTTLKHASMEDLSPKLLSIPLWQFFRLTELNNDHSNWFGPNCEAVVEAFESAGFETRLLKKQGLRATFHGKVKAGPPEFLDITSTEAVYYDFVTRHLLGKHASAEAAEAETSHGREFHERILSAVLTSREFYRRSGNRDDAWVQRLYACLLSPEAVPTGTEGRMRKLFADDQPYRQAVVDQLLSSTEYRMRRFGSFYTTYLGRVPSSPEVGYWLGTVLRGATLESVQAEFLASEEYFNREGGTNGQWLDGLYRQAQQKASVSERAVYLESLEGRTATRLEIATAFLKSLAYREWLVQSICNAYLGRPASDEEAQRSLTTLDGQTFRTSSASPWRRGLMRVFGGRRPQRVGSE
jgi:tRNA (mo5U34)-methyltransferase